MDLRSQDISHHHGRSIQKIAIDKAASSLLQRRSPCRSSARPSAGRCPSVCRKRLKTCNNWRLATVNCQLSHVATRRANSEFQTPSGMCIIALAMICRRCCICASTMTMQLRVAGACCCLESLSGGINRKQH